MKNNILPVQQLNALKWYHTALLYCHNLAVAFNWIAEMAIKGALALIEYNDVILPLWRLDSCKLVLFPHRDFLYL